LQRSIVPFVCSQIIAMAPFRTVGLVVAFLQLAFSDNTPVWEAKLTFFAADGTRSIPVDDAFFGLFSNVKPFNVGALHTHLHLPHLSNRSSFFSRACSCHRSLAPAPCLIPVAWV
jgi:hypothetical protein